MATPIPTLEANPCGRLEALRAIRDQLITGGHAAEVEFEQGGGTRRKVRYTAANLSALSREIVAAEAACSGNSRPGRYVFGGRMS